MNERIRQYNWKESPLGAVEGWKQSLRSALGICLNSNFPIGIYWGEQLILLYNDAWSSIPGNKHPWALGRPAKEVWPEIWDDIEPQFAKAFSGEAGGSKDAMLPMQRHGYTEECYFDFTFTPVFGEDGKVEGIFNAVIETTFRVIHERRAALLQTLSRKINSRSSPGEVFKKVSAVIKRNPADIPFCFIYIISAKQQDPLLVASTCPEVRLKNHAFTDLIKNGESIYTHDLSRFMDKIPVMHWPEEPAEGIFSPFKGNNGEVTGFLFTGLSARREYDRNYHLFVESLASIISAELNTIQSLEEERNRAEAINIARLRLAESEAELRIAKEQLEITFKNVSASIYLFDNEGKILFLNHQAARITQIDSTVPEPAHRDLQWIHDRILDQFEVYDEGGKIFSLHNSPALTTLGTGQTSERVIHFVNKSDGSHQWVLANAAPLLDEQGRLRRVLATSTDITIQKQAEQKLEFLVKKRTEELQRSNEDLQQFAHVASHDMKEPIRKIKIYSELLGDEFNEQFNDQANLYLSKIQTASNRMLTMMDGVLRYAGMDGSLQDIETIDLNDTIRAVESDLEIVIQKKNAEIKKDILPKIDGYAILIYQLFYNLISNALKFSKPDQRPFIEVLSNQETYENRIYHQIIIRDNGIGFEQEDAERIFHSFARLNAREDYEGTGLGLSLCKKIVYRHRGYLSATGRPGAGAEFNILLPQMQDG